MSRSRSRCPPPHRRGAALLLHHVRPPAGHHVQLTSTRVLSGTPTVTCRDVRRHLPSGDRRRQRYRVGHVQHRGRRRGRRAGARRDRRSVGIRGRVVLADAAGGDRRIASPTPTRRSGYRPASRSTPAPASPAERLPVSVVSRLSTESRIASGTGLTTLSPSTSRKRPGLPLTRRAAPISPTTSPRCTERSKGSTPGLRTAGLRVGARERLWALRDAADHRQRMDRSRVRTARGRRIRHALHLARRRGLAVAGDPVNRAHSVPRRGSHDRRPGRDHHGRHVAPCSCNPHRRADRAVGRWLAH